MTISRRLFAPLTVVLLLGVLWLAGCSGNDGPAGQDGTAPDNVPPTIALTSPLPGDTLSDTLLVSANATDNAGIDKVLFYLDGSNRDNDTGYVRLVESPYRYTWDLVKLGVTDGPHTIVGRAFDIAGNVADTPPIIVYTKRLIRPGETTLRHWGEDDSLSVTGFPVLNVDSSAFLVDSLWTRFTMERSGTVDSVAVYLDSLSAENVFDTSLLIYVYRSNGVYPTRSVAGDTIDIATVETTGFYKVGFNPGPTFAQGEKFHILVTVAEPTDSTRFGLRSVVIPRYPFATDNMSGMYRNDGNIPGHWVTMQEVLPAPFTREFLLEAVVTYE